MHTCNPNTQEAEAGGLGVQGQPGLQRKTLCQETKQKNLLSELNNVE
jgi:hypothetical protein